MRKILAMIAVASLFAAPSYAASQCKNAAGRFVKCPEAKAATVKPAAKTAALTKTREAKTTAAKAAPTKTAHAKTAAVSKMAGKKGPCRDAHGRFAKCPK